MKLREEAKNWWIQAKNDPDAANKNLEMKLYYVAAFLSQQATETALKALYIAKKKALPENLIIYYPLQNK